MINAPLLFETALLMLAAFLAGALLGLVLRVVLTRPQPAVAPLAEPKTAEAPATQDLVKAPEITTVSAPRRTAGQRLAAAAGKPVTDLQPAIRMPELSLPDTPVLASIQPSRVAGETVSGRHIDNPERTHAASLDDVRAELQAQIGAAPLSAADASEDATIVPVALAAPDEPPPEPSAALAAEAETPMLAEITDDAAEVALPVEERVEPAIEAEPVELLDPPQD
ncbi:MAG: hypothetical protein EOP19_25740, partial [Hyphomicrobiales bacterium]